VQSSRNLSLVDDSIQVRAIALTLAVLIGAGLGEAATLAEEQAD
jgi:hypothetical protein